MASRSNVCCRKEALIAATIYALWALTLLLQAASIVYMLRRGLRREYAWFFNYIVWSAARSVAMFGLLRLYAHKVVSYTTYFYVFWVSDVISMALCVAVAYSVTRRLFQDFEMLRRYALVAFGIALAGLLAGAILLSDLDAGNEKALLGATLMLNRSLLFVQVGLVVLTCAFAAWAALPWRRDVNFGIALGFGVGASVEIIAVTMRTEVGSSANTAYQVLRSLSYLVAVLTWFLYIRAPQKEQQIGDHLAGTNELDSLNQALAEMLTK